MIGNMANLPEFTTAIQSSRLQKHFTGQELRDLEAHVAKNIQDRVSLWNLPIIFVCGDLSYNSWFPEEVRELSHCDLARKLILCDYRFLDWCYSLCDIL